MSEKENVKKTVDERIVLENGEANMDAFWAIVNDRYDKCLEEQKK